MQTMSHAQGHLHHATSISYSSFPYPRTSLTHHLSIPAKLTKPSFLVRMDSRKHGDFSLTSPLGSSRLEKVKRKGLKVAAKKAAGGADDARLERWAVREFGAFGLAHGDGFGFGLEPSPSMLKEGAVMEFGVLGLPMVMGMGLSWSPGPKLLMKGLIAPQANHSHGPCPFQDSPFGYFISK